ncbi:MAG: site-specific DNA-methyltransferase [Holosporales bacterium]|jgi:hypothetical protein|nr:site-specific DNA-methyltransferase [Holosporales bacterium]
MEQSLPNVSAFEAAKLPRHRWYYFKEAFSPAIVEHMIRTSSLSVGSVVFDPFSGSGTTLLTAAQSDMFGAGIEVNPFLRFVAETKGLQADEDDFLKAIERAIEGAKSGLPSHLEEFSTFSEKAPLAQTRDRWLFNSNVLRAYSGASKATENEPSSVQKLAKLCLIGAAMDCANASKDGKCLRYKKDWKSREYNKFDFIDSLEVRSGIVYDDLKACNTSSYKISVNLGDCRNFDIEKKFDLCVTSPPYLNSFDYTDVYRPELFLGRFVSNMNELANLRFNTLRSHVQIKWKDPVENEFGPKYKEAFEQISSRITDLWNTRLPLMIQAYFEDLCLVLRTLRKKAKTNASMCIVVSTSAYAGVEIPVDLIIADLANQTGWALREVTVLRHLKRVSCQQWHKLNERKNGPLLRESMVVLDATPMRG